MMASFAENLAQLESADDCARLELLDATGATIATIENRPGSQGSLKVYRHLANKWGAIDIHAAQEGLALFAEHTADAQRNPGKHPNIDRLLDIIAEDRQYGVRIVLQGKEQTGLSA